MIHFPYFWKYRVLVIGRLTIPKTRGVPLNARLDQGADQGPKESGNPWHKSLLWFQRVRIKSGSVGRLRIGKVGSFQNSGVQSLSLVLGFMSPVDWLGQVNSVQKHNSPTDEVEIWGLDWLVYFWKVPLQKTLLSLRNELGEVSPRWPKPQMSKHQNTENKRQERVELTN
jgi:hypothetical protein